MSLYKCVWLFFRMLQLPELASWQFVCWHFAGNRWKYSQHQAERKQRNFRKTLPFEQTKYTHLFLFFLKKNVSNFPILACIEGTICSFVIWNLPAKHFTLFIQFRYFGNDVPVLGHIQIMTVQKERRTSIFYGIVRLRLDACAKEIPCEKP